MLYNNNDTTYKPFGREQVRTMEKKKTRPSTAHRRSGEARTNEARLRSAGKAYARPIGQRPPTKAHTPSSKGRGTVQRRRQRRSPGIQDIQSIVLVVSDFLSTPRGIGIAAGSVAAVVLLFVIIGLLTPRGGQRDVVRETPTQVEDTAVTVDETTEDAQPVMAQTVSTAGGYAPTGDRWREGKYAPEPQAEGYLPVFRSAAREDKVIAVTVDDCFQHENLKEIIKSAEAVGGKLTIFPIGNLLKRTELQEVIKAAHANGHEIENHTWSHDGLYGFNDVELANHIFDQDRAVDLVLGINYYTHFLRPKGGDDRNDLRTHSYIRQLGYYGIAHWSVSGAMDIEKIKSSLAPGAVYLFHCTDADLTKLREFIPYAAGQGYQLITFNDMFGYADNIEEPLTDDPMTREVIQLAPYTKDYKTLKATTYDYAAYEVQAALIEKGFLTGQPDGVYGPGTAKSAANWQATNGYPGDGVLTPEQQKKLLGIEA